MIEAPFKQLGGTTRGGIVCVADHASNEVPLGIELGIDRSMLNNHIAVDIGVNGVVERLARRHGMPAHIATVSRLVCDLHREEDHRNVVPTESDGHLIPGNIGADISSRLETIYHPYQNALGTWLDAQNPGLILSIHSFTPSLESDPRDRPWEVALLYNQDDRAARIAIRLFEEQGMTVGDNEPYSGKELNATMNRHAEAQGRPYCAIEIRNDLIQNEAGQSRFAALIADVAGRVKLFLESA